MYNCHLFITNYTDLRNQYITVYYLLANLTLGQVNLESLFGIVQLR